MRNGVLGFLAALVLGAAFPLAQPLLAEEPAQSTPGSPQSAAGANPAPQVPKVCPPTGEAPVLPPESGCGIDLADGPNAFTAKPKKSELDWHLPALEGPDRVWVTGEYLLWWLKDAPVPGPLVTSGPAGSGAILGNAGTSVLVGDRGIDYGPLSGGRMFVGFCNETHTCALEVGALLLESGGATFAAGGNGIDIARPFFNTATGQESALLVNSPGAFAGNVKVSSATDLFGAEANVLENVSRGDGVNFDLLLGFRYLSLEEALSIAQATTLLPGGTVGFNGGSITGSGAFTVSDDFKTRNEFYGGQIGAQLDYQPGRFFLNLVAKLGIGNTHETFVTSGQTELFPAGGAPSTALGGLLAVPGNIGLASRNAFTLVPEGMVTVGFAITDCWRAFVGYTFLYWDDVVRPGSSASRAVNASLVPSSLGFGTGLGPTPTVSTNGSSDFWAQGLHFGMAIRY
jgi:hypothetical protein